jgi:hypothetical protein
MVKLTTIKDTKSHVTIQSDPSVVATTKNGHRKGDALSHKSGNSKVPHRHDLPENSCVNNAVKIFNRKLRNI